MNRELYKKNMAQQETWVLEKPTSYKSPPKFIDGKILSDNRHIEFISIELIFLFDI